VVRAVGSDFKLGQQVEQADNLGRMAIPQLLYQTLPHSNYLELVERVEPYTPLATLDKTQHWH
jgi:hypothetical protein